eukprot:RCo015362
MEAIYHEKQEAALCGMHALNNLLQGCYFTPEVLVTIAEELDAQELSLSPEAFSGPLRDGQSQNISDSGDFSIQVISKALETLGLQLHHFNKPEMAHAKADPNSEKGFLCNQDEHWLALRRFGDDWFDINSSRESPQWLSPTHLGLYLEQLLQSGYTVFVVVGTWPHCVADDYFACCSFKEQQRRLADSLLQSLAVGGETTRVGQKRPEDPTSLSVATAAAPADQKPSPDSDGSDESNAGNAAVWETEDEQLRRALQESLKSAPVRGGAEGSPRLELDAKTGPLADEEELALAIAMSLNPVQGGKQ